MTRRNIEDLQVAPAHPARFDGDEDVIRLLDPRCGAVLEAQFAVTVKDGGTHQLPSRFIRCRPTRRTRPEPNSRTTVASNSTVATAFTSGVTPNLICV